uniref:Cytochrome b n=1 Tax=Ascaris lumbricoides TaxID=6252 RepID=A0A0M3IDF8_ASCLU
MRELDGLIHSHRPALPLLFYEHDVVWLFIIYFVASLLIGDDHSAEEDGSRLEE